MVKALAHRGPDGEGLYPSAAHPGDRPPLVALGLRRLAILDTTSAGAQPMGGQGEQPCVTYNGETYNYAQLRSDLEQAGVPFFSRSDTEVVLRGYDTWGVHVLQRLR